MNLRCWGQLRWLGLAILLAGAVMLTASVVVPPRTPLDAVPETRSPGCDRIDSAWISEC